METIDILCLTSNKKFLASIGELLSPPGQFSLYPIASLEDPELSRLRDTASTLIVDIDSLPGDPAALMQEIQDRLPAISLLLITNREQRLVFPSSIPAYQFTWHSIQNSLFPPFVQILSNQAELVKNYSQSQADLSKRITELDLIRKASLHLTMNLSLDTVLETILESALELIEADDTHIFLYEHGLLTFASALFEGTQQQEPFMDPRPDGVTYHVAREGEKRVVNNMLEDSLFSDNRWEGAIISLPLKIGQKVLGVMNVALHRPHIFTKGEIRVLEFLGDQAAIAIQNAKLYEQAQQEIADRKKAEKAIQHLANHDALTGLPNRRLFNERIELEIARSLRNNLRFSVMLFDLDQLKNVNDMYGHNIGDLLLQAVSQRLLGLLRKSDTIARMGGDEFLLILPEMNQLEDATHTAERILSALSTPFHLETHQIQITTSIGISLFPDDGKDVNTLVKKADISMYKAKERGGNTYHTYTS